VFAEVQQPKPAEDDEPQARRGAGVLAGGLTCTWPLNAMHTDAISVAFQGKMNDSFEKNDLINSPIQDRIMSYFY